MAGPRLPIEVVKARGAKHLTKAEIKTRQENEIKPITDNIEAPDYLTKKQQSEFYKIADQLQKLKILGETDVDALARFIIANELYVYAAKQVRKPTIRSDVYELEQWSKIQDRYFKQCRQCANDLGLSISSRCKLVVPKVNEEVTKINKFEKFKKIKVADSP